MGRLYFSLSCCIVIISFFKVYFYVTFYNYKKPINVNQKPNCKIVSVFKFDTSSFLGCFLFFCVQYHAAALRSEVSYLIKRGE